MHEKMCDERGVGELDVDHVNFFKHEQQLTWNVVVVVVKSTWHWECGESLAHVFAVI